MSVKKGTKQKGNECIICGSEISPATAARASHMRKHVRDGSLSESKDKDGKCEWAATGCEPKENEKEKYIFKKAFKTLSFKPRKPKIAKSKNNNIVIKCTECGKFNKSRKFGDERFMVAECNKCNVMSIFPTRMTDKLLNSPGKEYIE